MSAPDADERAEIVGALAEHRQHHPRTGSSTCVCGKWAGPFTLYTGPRSFAAHLAEALAPTVARLIEDAVARAVARHVRSKHAADCEAFTTPLGKCTCDREAERRRAIEDAVAERLAGVEALAKRLALFDCLEHDDQVPGSVDVPDDYEHGLHDAAKQLRAALSGGGEQ